MNCSDKTPANGKSYPPRRTIEVLCINKTGRQWHDDIEYLSVEEKDAIVAAKDAEITDLMIELKTREEEIASLREQVLGLVTDLQYTNERVAELKGVLDLKEDEYVKQVGTWKIIQRLEESEKRLETRCARYKTAIKKISKMKNDWGNGHCTPTEAAEIAKEALADENGGN
jgi:hypothetical protein